jgi:iron complex transport system permease protein
VSVTSAPPPSGTTEDDETVVTRSLSGLVLRSRSGAISVRLDLRAVLVVAVLLLLTLAIGVFSLTTGDFEVPVGDVVRSLTGRGDAGTDFIVLTLRLPRLAAAVLVGAALGVSGAIFQNLSRNPLGSPDFIGLTGGAATGALVVILLLDGGAEQVTVGAVAGCVVTAAAIYLLAYRRGSAAFRLVLIGIGVSAMLDAFNSFLITRARLDEALGAQIWLVGSLNGRSWDQIWPVVGAVVVLLPVAFWQSRRLALLGLGDETAMALGVPVERTRLILFTVSVLLAGVATAVCGPIAFVALAAPQLALRLTRTTGAGLGGAAVMGAFLLTVSDWVAQRALPSGPLPVGITTGVIGGAYLCWLLFHEWRKG